jgi:hypothetical protein
MLIVYMLLLYIFMNSDISSIYFTHIITIQLTRRCFYTHKLYNSDAILP